MHLQVHAYDHVQCILYTRSSSCLLFSLSLFEYKIGNYHTDTSQRCFFFSKNEIFLSSDKSLSIFWGKIARKDLGGNKGSFQHSFPFLIRHYRSWWVGNAQNRLGMGQRPHFNIHLKNLSFVLCTCSWAKNTQCELKLIKN